MLQIADWPTNNRQLVWRRKSSYLEIADDRLGMEHTHRLKELEGDVYLACDAGATPETIRKHIQIKHARTPSIDSIRNMLNEFVNLKLIYEENGRYLSLALNYSETQKNIL